MTTEKKNPNFARRYSTHKHSQEITKRAFYVIFSFRKSSGEHEANMSSKRTSQSPSFDSRALNDFSWGDTCLFKWFMNWLNSIHSSILFSVWLARAISLVSFLYVYHCKCNTLQWINSGVKRVCVYYCCYRHRGLFMFYCSCCYVDISAFFLQFMKIIM